MNAHRNALVALVVLLTTAIVAGAGCSVTRSGESPTPTATPTAGSTSPSPTPSVSLSDSPQPVVSVYFLRGAVVGAAHRTIAATNAPAHAALDELLAGPTSEELAAGMHTHIPPDTKVLGVTIRDGLATVDLSSAFAVGVDPLEDRGRLVQIVYTLTQFPTVDGVRFHVDGEPLVFRTADGRPLSQTQTRRSFEDMTPAIFVEQPAVGDEVSSPLNIQGTSNTFEAQLMVRVSDVAGRILVEKSATATSGMGTRGTFSTSVSFETDSRSIVVEVYEQSAASGLPIHVAKIPLPLATPAP
jgi:hypothetical protein